jgi:hypothetical protein
MEGKRKKPAKENDMDSKENRASAREPKGAGGRITASPKERFETATFAMG